MTRATSSLRDRLPSVPGRGPAELILERVLAGGLDEDGREELHAGLHAELLTRLLSLASVYVQ